MGIKWMTVSQVLPRRGPVATHFRPRLGLGTNSLPSLELNRREMYMLMTMAYGEPIYSDPEVRQLLAEASPSIKRGGRLNIIGNKHVSLDERIAAAEEVNLYWKLRLAVSEQGVPDETVLRWCLGDDAHVSLSQGHDLVYNRPQLLQSILDGPLRMAHAASTSLLLTDEGAEKLLKRLNLRTKLGQGTVRELALNPVLSKAVRDEALLQGTRSRSKDGKLRARLASDLVIPVKRGFDPLRVDAAMLISLMGWASGSLELIWSEARYTESSKPGIWHALQDHEYAQRIQDLMKLSLPNSLDSGFSDDHQPRMLLVPKYSPGPSNCHGLNRILASFVWDMETDSHWFTTPRGEAVALTVRAELGEDMRAWETFLALMPDWSGTVGQLINASLTLGSNE